MVDWNQPFLIYTITIYTIDIYNFGCVKGHEKSFKLYVYKSMVNGALNFTSYIPSSTNQRKKFRKSAAFSSKQKHDMLSKKSVIGNLLPQ